MTSKANADGTQKRLSEFIQTVATDKRVCKMCYLYGSIDCHYYSKKGCYMVEVLEDVIPDALYQVKSVIAPVTLLADTLKDIAEYDGR